MSQRAQRQPRAGPAPQTSLRSVVSLCNQLDAAIVLIEATYKDSDLEPSRLKVFAETLLSWKNVVAWHIQGALSFADMQLLASHAWSQPRNCCALVQLLVVILQQLTTALGGASGLTASGSACPRLSTRDAGHHQTCLMALSTLMTCLSGIDMHMPACCAQVASLLLRTHIPHALSRALAALTAALHDDDHPSTFSSLLHPILMCAECFIGMGLRAEEHPLRFSNTGTTDSTAAPSTTSTIPPSGKPVLIGPAMLWALADSSLAEHCCRAALMGFERGDIPHVLNSASTFLTLLGNLCCRLQLQTPQPVGGHASLTARDAVLSGPCLQYLLTADVLSSLHHAEGGGPLYGMPVRHLLPPKRQYRDITDVLYAQTLVCTVVPGPMRMHIELRHSTLAAARACFRYLRLVVRKVQQPGGADEEGAAAPFLAVNVTRQALELMQVMDLGPADPTITPHVIVGGQRGAAAAAGAGSSSGGGGGGGGAATGAGATGGGDAVAGERQPWVPGRRLGLRLLEEWWGSWLPLVHCMLDLGLVAPSGVEVYSRVGEQGGMVALAVRLAKTLALTLNTLTLKATALDEMPQGVPRGPCTSPNVAAALSAGYLPCLERLMRVAQRQAGTRNSTRTEVLLQPLTRSSVLPQLLAYGDVRQAAALVLTVGKLLRRMGPSSLVAEMPQHMGGGGGRPSAARDTMTWLVGTLVACLTHPDVALLWEQGQQEEGQREGQGGGGRGAQGPGAGAEGRGEHVEQQGERRDGEGRGDEQGQHREVEQGQEGTAQSHSGASSGSSGSGGGSPAGNSTGSSAADRLLPVPLPAPPPPLPAPTRQALSLMSLALARWTAACLNACSWDPKPADAHAEAMSLPANADTVAKTVAAVEAWDAATLSDALGVLRPMRLMLCAAFVAQARGDTRAAASWRRVLLRGMGLPGALAPVLEALAAVGKGAAAARGVDVVAEVDQSVTWLSAALPEEWGAAMMAPGTGGGPSRALTAMAAVCMAHGVQAEGAGGEEGIRELLGRVGQGEWEMGSEQVAQWMRKAAAADEALLRAAALLPPPCEAVQGMQLCGNPGCSNLGGDSEAGRPLQRCGGCRGVAYCCRGCQAEHWKEGGHKEECKGKRA